MPELTNLSRLQRSPISEVISVTCLLYVLIKALLGWSSLAGCDVSTFQFLTFRMSKGNTEPDQKTMFNLQPNNRVK